MIEPAEQAATPLERLRVLCEAFLSHVERRVFPGGCFFASAAAEFDTHPGAVRERISGSSAAGATCSCSRSRGSGRGANDPRRGPRPARLRAQRLPPARQRTVRDQRGVDADRQGAPRAGAPAHGSGWRCDHLGLPGPGAHGQCPPMSVIPSTSSTFRGVEALDAAGRRPFRTPPVHAGPRCRSAPSRPSDGC